MEQSAKENRPCGVKVRSSSGYYSLSVRPAGSSVPDAEVASSARPHIHTGLRREEAIWLTDEDVDLEKQPIRVQAKSTNGEFWQPKTKRNRVVPISRKLFDSLNGYRRPYGFIWFFPSPTGRRWYPDNFSQDLRKLNKAAGLVWFCLDFRHSFGSHLAQNCEGRSKGAAGGGLTLQVGVATGLVFSSGEGACTVPVRSLASRDYETKTVDYAYYLSGLLY